MKGIDKHHRGINIDMVDSEDKECERTPVKKETTLLGMFAPVYSVDNPVTTLKLETDRVVCVSKSRFEWADNLKDVYHDGLEGNQPEPIDKKYFDVIFNR